MIFAVCCVLFVVLASLLYLFAYWFSICCLLGACFCFVFEYCVLLILIHCVCFVLLLLFTLASALVFHALFVCRVVLLCYALLS